MVRLHVVLECAFPQCSPPFPHVNAIINEAATQARDLLNFLP
jgi:hypothetical protein